MSGQFTDSVYLSASIFVADANRLGQYGEWHYLMVTDPGRMAEEINPFATAQWSEGPFTLVE